MPSTMSDTCQSISSPLRNRFGQGEQQPRHPQDLHLWNSYKQDDQQLYENESVLSSKHRRESVTGITSTRRRSCHHCINTRFLPSLLDFSKLVRNPKGYIAVMPPLYTFGPRASHPQPRKKSCSFSFFWPCTKYTTDTKQSFSQISLARDWL